MKIHDVFLGVAISSTLFLLVMGVLALMDMSVPEHLHVKDLMVQECMAYLERQQECGNTGYLNYTGPEKERWIQGCTRVSCGTYNCAEDLSQNNLRLMPICIADIYRSDCPFVQIDGPCSNIHNSFLTRQ